MNIRFIPIRFILAAWGAVIAAVCLNFCTATARGEAITNGGFETGNFSAWTQGGDPSFTIVVTFGAYGDLPGPHSGADWAALGPDQADGTLSQTVSVIAGTTYDFSFWLVNDGSTPIDNHFYAAFDGATVLSLTNLPAQGWTQYSFLVTPSANTANVLFTFFDVPAHIGLDDVSLTEAPFRLVDPSAAPLPSTASGGIVLLAGMVVCKLRASRRAHC
jgi:hypothetical protein